jgi:cell division protein ZapA
VTKQTIPVEIQGQQYRIRSGGDRESVEQAARLVDETMGRLRERATVVDSLDIAVLAALNLANQFIGLRKREGEQARVEESEQIQSLVELVESALPAGSLSPH